MKTKSALLAMFADRAARPQRDSADHAAGHPCLNDQLESTRRKT
jgi:hypothetical protein